MPLTTYKSAVGRLLRLPLKAIPPERPLRILRGPLRGRRWIPGASVHGCWLGTFERYEQELLMRLTRPGDVVFDIGANVGFYTLLAAHLVGDRGSVVAFEPAARNVGYLRRHLELNALTNVRVLEAAVGDRVGTAVFETGPTFSEGRLVADDSPGPGQCRIGLVTLDDLLARGEVPLPKLLKIDVEGAEYAVLRGAVNLLERARPEILLSTHTTAVRAECAALLNEFEYDLRPMLERRHCESEIYCSPRRRARSPV
jgi:FkbM family methyltransferase